MLDQNTDRMWFVIGAVLIGAGLIAAANLLFPELFAQMAASFRGMLDNATGGLSDIDFDGGSTINLLKGLF